ncbi:hypothetical protein [Corynebacterium comes]|uniref:Uncharacterized protein n=1 Tax=Corynebacterium comes TaxID=2675218 RepID=A0A6B8VQ26_9CORY|nr:hypothetical protein [Corynebacterium comes]QGU03514.1 hypothetical protein CETAM_01105 [Corynebacterium comes]
MSSNGARRVGQVVDLTAARARRQRLRRTVILRAANVRADAEVHRHIGVNDALHLADLHDVLVASFGFQEERGATPWHFSSLEDRDKRLDAADELHLHLSDEGDSIAYHFGLWDIIVTAVESYPRDTGTPRALCVGGSGAFGGTEFDLAAINAELTGTTTIREVLMVTTPAVRGIIDRSGIFDFVPLLQALDLTREVGLPEDVANVLGGLPVETDPPARDAFWSVVLGLACMGDELLGNHVLETTMAALGWEDGDGTPLTGARIRELCVRSLTRLAEVGGYGPDALSPVERLDIYRELLRE